MKKINILSNVITFIILALFAIITLVPIVYMISCSFKTNSEILAYPDRFLPMAPTVENFTNIWTSQFINIGRMLVNSVYYTVLSVLITLLTSSITAFVFARYAFPGKKLLFAIFSALMFVSFGSITIYPQFEILGKLNLANSINGLLFMKLFGCGIVNIYLVKSYIETLPRSLDESASIDGCGLFGTFFKIILPLLKPIMATVGLLAFNGSWNEYLMPTLFTISRPEQQTLIVGLMALKNSGEAASSWNLMMAGCVITLLPILSAYIFFNRFFITGITEGAVKG
ncbi:MAG: carbohydrate ABC transporter permease [Clostridia bacterium]|nr:carbohydrate ABC transporter permease [Clostridia bacterium]